MRMDLPSDRAAWGSFFEPKSTMSTTATMSIFHGLSNRSPIISALFSRRRVPALGQLPTGSLHVPDSRVLCQRSQCVIPDPGRELRWRDDPPFLPQPQREPPYPLG